MMQKRDIKDVPEREVTCFKIIRQWALLYIAFPNILL